MEAGVVSSTKGSLVRCSKGSFAHRSGESVLVRLASMVRVMLRSVVTVVLLALTKWNPGQYCIVLYLYIYIAPLAVHTNQKRFQCERPRENRTVLRVGYDHLLVISINHIITQSINQHYIAPLQDPYSEELPTQAKRKEVFESW